MSPQNMYACHELMYGKVNTFRNFLSIVYDHGVHYLHNIYFYIFKLLFFPKSFVDVYCEALIVNQILTTMYI